jgi:tetratricopeptide (TPR) repeat protein
VANDTPERLIERGNALYQAGRLAEALAAYEQALAIDSALPQAWNNRGLALQGLKRYDEALASYKSALNVKQDFADALSNCGFALLELKRPAEALEWLEAALVAQPRSPIALTNRGNALFQLGRLEDALESHQRALRIDPRFAGAQYNLGNVLSRLGRLEDALIAYDRALEIVPHYAEALCNRGIVLHQLGQAERALECLERALALNEGSKEAWSNRGNLLQKLGRHEEALESYEKAIAIEPNLAEPHWNAALCRLKNGDFERGWQGYERRWECGDFTSSRRNFEQARLSQPAQLRGKTVLLHAEQGFGDTIQFVRYAPLVVERGAQIILEVQPQLKRLLSGLLPRGRVVGRGEPLPDFDCHCPLLSLPGFFGTTLETIPGNVPYLTVPADTMRKWQKTLPKSEGRRMGIAWSGRPSHPNDRNRSIALRDLLPPLLGSSFEPVSLQREVRRTDQDVLDTHPHVRHFGAELTDFCDTAALVMLMDLVVSVDTSIAHLAAALGKPVWILLPFEADWRWLRSGLSSPWYPTARLFRQPSPRDWASVLGEVQAALRAAERSSHG